MQTGSQINNNKNVNEYEVSNGTQVKTMNSFNGCIEYLNDYRIGNIYRLMLSMLMYCEIDLSEVEKTEACGQMKLSGSVIFIFSCDF